MGTPGASGPTRVGRRIRTRRAPVRAGGGTERAPLDFINSLDLSTEEGQAAWRELLQDTLRKFDEGIFRDNPELLAGTIDDFIAIAGDSADALNALGESARGAIAELTNVPAGFKVALARFNSTLDVEIDRRLKDVLSEGPIIERGRFPSPFGTDGAAHPRAGALSQTIINVEQGAIVVQGWSDAVATADAVLQALRTRARGQTGDTRNWPGLR